MSQQTNQDVTSDVYKNRYTVTKNYILNMLGSPLIRIELTDEMILTCIIDAVTMYHTYATIDYNMIPVAVTSNPFPIPTSPPGINKQTIVDVIFEATFFDTLGSGIASGGFVGEFEGSVIPIFNEQGILNIFTQFNLPDYYSYLQRLEDIKNIIGIQQMWEVFNNQIHIFPINNPIMNVGIVYRGTLTDDEAEEQVWIKHYSLEKARYVLGTVRSKFTGVNAAGVNLAADGEQLKSEAKTEIEKLETELKGFQRPMPIIKR